MNEVPKPAVGVGSTDAESALQWCLRPLRSPNALLLAGGLLLPNLLSLMTLTSLVDIGLPPRFEVITLYATLALLARRIPFALTTVLFFCLLSFDMVRTLSLMFGLAPTEFLAALDQARRIHLFASPLYLSLIGAILVMPMSLLTAPLGVRVAHAMSKKTLERSYGAYLLIVGTRFAVTLWNGS